MGGVRDQEIAFTVPLVTETVSAKPRARVEDVKTVVEDVSEAIVNANLSPTSRIIEDRAGELPWPEHRHQLLRSMSSKYPSPEPVPSPVSSARSRKLLKASHDVSGARQHAWQTEWE